MTQDTAFREEKDAMGPVQIPADAYYGASTKRAMDNFPISGLRLPPAFIRSLALIKRFAALVNRDLGLLETQKAEAIAEAAAEIMAGRLADQFQVDVFQTGSGTSTNMNVNEVIATRANEALTGQRATKAPVHPNDHVNLGQSSNDVIPTALHVSAWHRIQTRLVPALETLHLALQEKAVAFADIPKIGRTHLQDAVPMFLGQEFSGYARQIELGIERLEAAGRRLSALALGGTAVGTGLNTHPDFARLVVEQISTHLSLTFRETENHFEAQAAQDAAVETSGALRTIAIGMSKIANDLRWLASGPRCGLGEIVLPELQPGSSIMPGKVNPVICEAVIQVATQVMGNDTTIMTAGQAGVLELNTMLPVIAHNLLQSIELLANAGQVFAEKCIQGIRADTKRCQENIEKSLALATYLVPRIGYDKAAVVAQKAHASGKTVREVVLAEGLMAQNEFDRLIKPV